MVLLISKFEEFTEGFGRVFKGNFIRGWNKQTINIGSSLEEGDEEEGRRKPFKLVSKKRGRFSSRCGQALM